MLDKLLELLLLLIRISKKTKVDQVMMLRLKMENLMKLKKQDLL
jgi:hypothetical protein